MDMVARSVFSRNVAYASGVPPKILMVERSDGLCVIGQWFNSM